PTEEPKGEPKPRRNKQLLDRALDRIERGQMRAAMPDLRRFLKDNPEDAEGHSCLGICLLETGDAVASLPHLDLACVLERDQALHHWNLAAAAQKARRVGRCYLALKGYLAAHDEGPEADERHEEAVGFIAEYEAGVHADHPGVDPERLARGEDLFLRAFEALGQGRGREAAQGFEQVLRFVPTHYPA